MVGASLSFTENIALFGEYRYMINSFKGTVDESSSAGSDHDVDENYNIGTAKLGLEVLF